MLALLTARAVRAEHSTAVDARGDRPRDRHTEHFADNRAAPYAGGMNAPPQVVELERRIRWPGWPTLLFLAILALLLVLVAITLVLRPPRPRGLPEDPVMLAATGLPDRSFHVLTGDLRFAAAAFGGAPGPGASGTASLARAREVEQALVRWSRSHPREPRIRAALGALALVRHDYAEAARRYREACERAPHYSEGRLGWGVALGLDAARTSEPWERRALMLHAIAQFAASNFGYVELTDVVRERKRAEQCVSTLRQGPSQRGVLVDAAFERAVGLFPGLPIRVDVVEVPFELRRNFIAAPIGRGGRCRLRLHGH